MKMLHFTDVHGSEEALEWVKARAHEFEVLIAGGDLTRSGQLEFTKRFLGMLAGVGVPVLYVHGNADPKDLPIPSELRQLHGNSTKIQELTFGGLGGSNPTPFKTPFELTDQEAEKVLERLGPVDVLISHCPPVRTKCDTTSAGENIGSRPVRRYVERHKPKLVLSGHVHEAKGLDKIGGTIVANPGPLMWGNYTVLEDGARLRVELKSEKF